MMVTGIQADVQLAVDCCKCLIVPLYPLLDRLET